MLPSLFKTAFIFSNSFLIFDVDSGTDVDINTKFIILLSDFERICGYLCMLY